MFHMIPKFLNIYPNPQIFLSKRNLSMKVSLTADEAQALPTPDIIFTNSIIQVVDSSTRYAHSK